MKKTFDCVEMKRQGQARIQQETRGMTPQQLLDYWTKANNELLEHQRKAKERSQRRSA